MLPREVRKPHRILRPRDVALVLAICASTCIYEVSQPRPYCTWRSSKKQVARIAVHKFLDEALPQWQVAHGRHCPNDLTELTPFMNSDDVKDPWGHPYILICNTDRPSPGVVVLSTGPDGMLGSIETDDDDDIYAVSVWRQ